MMRDYPKQDQRLAVCFSQFRARKMTLSKQELTIIEDAITKGKALHDELGKAVVVSQIQDFKDVVAHADIHILNDLGNVVEIITLKIKKMLAGLRKK